MGIRLDWEVESDAGWDEIGEDPEVLRRRRNFRRNIRLLLILVAALLVSAAVAISVRLRQVRGQLKSTLEQTVAAETLALRLGDEAAFMRGQANISRWRRFQEDVFEDYQDAAPDRVASGDIIALDIVGSDARVVLRETVDDEPHEVVWYYHHDDTGWYHVPDVPAYWGEPRHTITAYADITHVPPDQLYAETLAARIDALMARICALNVCGPDMPRFALNIDPDAMAQIHWDGDTDPVLTIPSPQQIRRPVGEPAQPVEETVVRRWLVTWWSTQVLGGLNDQPIERWLEPHLDLWLNHELDPSWSSSRFFDSLEAAYGQDFVSRYTLRMQSGDDLVTALSTTIDESATADDLAAVLTANLRFEFALRSAGYTEPADDLFVSGANTESDPITRAQFLLNSDAASIQVVNTRPVDDMLWAEVRFQPSVDDENLYGSLLGAVPFVEDEGRWLRIEPTIQDWGPLSYTQGDNIRIFYYELDREFALQIFEFLEDEVYPVVAADFGLEQPLPEVALITPDPDDYSAILNQQYASSPEDWQLVIPSPYLYLLRGETSIDGAVRRLSATVLLHDIFAQLTEERAYDSIRIALIDWEMNRLGLTYWDYYGQAINEADPHDLRALALDDLWANARTVVSRDQALEHASAVVLVDLLAERYGDDIIATLVQNLPEATTTTEWLELSGIDSDQVQSEWLARVSAMLASERD